MKKRLTFLLIIAAFTVSGILLFQAYWVYKSYKTGEQNLTTSLTAILQRSIDNYQMQQFKLPASLNDKSPHLDVMEWKMSTPGDSGKKGTLLKFDEVGVAINNVNRVKLMIAQLLASKENRPVRLDSLSQFFTAELRKSNLRLPFTLSLLQHQQRLPENKIASFVNLSGPGTVVIAEMNDIGHLLLKQNLFPALISLMLILLSGGSLFYMFIVIRRQIKLDNMKNAFLSNIAHEFRTPLSILKSTHEILLDFGEMRNPEKTGRYLNTNREIIQKLEANVERILDISRFESVNSPAKQETVSISELVAAIIARFKIASDIELTLINDDALTTVISDGFIIDTAISNLIDNAIKYGGTDISVILVRFESGWGIIVTDNGWGISPEHLPFIFDKFYRVPSGDLHEVKGYGLGLSYVRQLVTSLNGQIEVRSKVNAGTTFTVKFPMS